MQEGELEGEEGAEHIDEGACNRQMDNGWI